MKAYPFTSQVTYDDNGLPQYDRAVNSEFLRKVYAQYFSDGVFYNPADALQVTVDTGMNVKVLPGVCHIQGAMAIEDSPRVLAVQASGELDRIDTVVARLDLALGVRSIDLYVLKGAPADTPAAPALTRNNTVWELGLADLFVAKNTTSISQQRITDTRLDTARCGQVMVPLAPADFEPYFAQLQAAIAAHDTAAMEQIAELGRVMTEAGQPYGGIMTYTHTKNGTMHELTGSGNNIKFAASAAFKDGDTIAVNGNACAAKTVAGDALWGGFWAKGAVVTAWLNEAGDALNFSGAGLSEADKAQLVPGNLLSGVSINSGGVRVAGGIPRKAAAIYTPGTSDQVLAAGQYLEGAQTIKGDANLAAGNILSGVTLFGVTGNVIPYSNSSGGVIAVICGFGNGDYGYGEPYFSFSGSVLTCKMACNVSISAQGQANSGTSGQAWGYIRKNGATILTCKESYNWFSGSVGASFAPGDTLTISITGNDPKAMMVRVTLK